MKAQTIILMAVAVLIPSIAAAQGTRDLPETGRQVITVTGEATASAQPDEVWIDLGVVTNASTAEQAASENAKKVEQVLAALRSELGRNASIRTVNYSLNPDYEAPPMPREGQPAPRGYVAANIVQIRTGELGKVGRLIDVAIRAGANSVHRVEFSLRDRSQPLTTALREATQKARTKAETIASALGVKIVRIIAVEEGGGRYPYPMASRMGFDAAESATSIEAGTVDIMAMVTMTVEVQ